MASEIVGPVPPGIDPQIYDRLRRRVLWSLPSGLYLLGSRVGEERNLMTLNWATQVATEPKLLAVSVEKHAKTAELIRDGSAFSLSLLGKSDRAIVRRFARPAIHDPSARTLSDAAYFDAPVSGAPVLKSSVAYLDCRLHSCVELGSHILYLGEIVDAAFLAEEDVEVLSMGDTRMNYGG